MEAYIPRLQPAGDICGQAVCAAALLFAARRTVQIRAAALHLGPEDVARVTDAESERGPVAPSVWKQRLRKPRFAFAFFSTISLCSYALIQFVSGRLIPLLPSHTALDWLWITFCWLFSSAFAGGALSVLIPVPTGIRYVRSNTDDSSSPLVLNYVPLDTSATLHQKPTRYGLSAALGALLVLGGWWTPTLRYAAEVAVIMAVPYTMPNLSVRRVSQGLVAFPIVTVVFSGVIGVFVLLFDSSSSEPASEKARKEALDSLPSFWILHLASAYFDAWAWIGAGLLASMTLRYEYFAAAASPSVERDEASRSIIVPTTLPKVSTPLFGTAILCTFTAMVCLHATSWVAGQEVMTLVIPMNAVFVVPAMTALAVALGARRSGQLREWWQYYELWATSATLEFEPVNPEDGQGPSLERTTLK